METDENGLEGRMILNEEVDMKALRIIRDNFSEIYAQMKSFKAFDSKTHEKKEVDEKTAYSIINELYQTKKDSCDVKYRFIARLKSGRRFARNSLQGLTKPIRHAIAKDLYYDVDMKNAHPTFCLALCQSLKFHHSKLEKYVMNRNQLLEEWVGVRVGALELKTTDEVKTYFLKVLNGGGSANSDNDDLNEFYITHQQFLDLFFKHKDFKRFRERAIKKYKDKVDREWDNKKGTCLNYYLCEIENNALTHMEHYLQEVGIDYGTLCFDGIMIYKRCVPDLKDLLKKLEERLLSKMGFSIVLTSKEMEDGVDLTGLTEKADVDMSDESLTLYLLDVLKDDILYDHYQKKLWMFDTTTALWLERSPSHIHTMITKILDPHIKTSPDEDLIENALTMIRSQSKQSALVRLCEPHLKMRRDDDFIRTRFDRTVGVFPIADNKVIDLKTGLVRDRVRLDYFTKTTTRTIVQVPEDKRKEVLQYYSDMLKTTNTEHRDCLIYTQAYALTGENHLKKFVNFIGLPDGGKSAYIEHHVGMMGSFAGQANERLFVAQKNKACHDSEMFNLCGRRMSCLTETEESQRFNEQLIKKVSGKDTVNIRGAGQMDTIDIQFDAVLFLATNQMCQFSDPAFKTRLMCFNFCNKFEKNAEFPKKLVRDRDYYFTVLCEYAKSFYDKGMTFTISKEVESYTASIVDEQDTIKKWCEEQNTFVKGDIKDYVIKPDLFMEYQEFWKGSGRKYEGKIAFYRAFQKLYALEDAVKIKIPSSDNITVWGYRGLKRED